MSGLFNFNASIQTSWKASLQTILQKLRRVSFVVEDTFSWGNFEPTLTYSGGMTGTAYFLRTARYLKIWKFLWFRFDFDITPVAPLSTTIYFSLPATTPGDVDVVTGTHVGQTCLVLITGAVTNEVGSGYIGRERNQLSIQRANNAAFTAVQNRITCNGFIEVL